ncbi:MAG: DKNYY domain-containing protein [Bacteroidia bacterium]|nr:DKNYY domain-containing protein [Bacteroidia bacterium]HQV01311.1 DKNYY domain-containing protein [Bacteroidia bacterium]
MPYSLLNHFIKTVAFAALLLVISACSSGYKKEAGQWVWVSYDEMEGKRITMIEGVDAQTFNVLTNENYAVDKNAVYYTHRKIKYADPATFKVLTDGYAVDKYHVFFDYGMILFADPATFQSLGFLYSKDKNDVYCGMIPLHLSKADLNLFTVTGSKANFSNTKSAVLTSHFIELNPEFAWIDTLQLERIIVGDYTTGQAGPKKFYGFKQVK